jgi:hypothetical protein
MQTIPNGNTIRAPGLVYINFAKLEEPGVVSIADLPRDAFIPSKHGDNVASRDAEVNSSFGREHSKAALSVSPIAMCSWSKKVPVRRSLCFRSSISFLFRGSNIRSIADGSGRFVLAR